MLLSCYYLLTLLFGNAMGTSHFTCMCGIVMFNRLHWFTLNTKGREDVRLISFLNLQRSFTGFTFNFSFGA